MDIFAQESSPVPRPCFLLTLEKFSLLRIKSKSLLITYCKLMPSVLTGAKLNQHIPIGFSITSGRNLCCSIIPVAASKILHLSFLLVESEASSKQFILMNYLKCAFTFGCVAT